MLGRLLTQVVADRRENAVRRKRAARSASLPKAALIFGAGSYPGIGAAVARRAAAGGLHVLATGRSVDKLADTVAAIRAAGGTAEALPVDVTAEAQIAAAFEQIATAGYAVDLVVHNVGTNRPGKFLDIRPDHLEKSWRADCLSGFLVAQHAIRHMLEHGRGTLLFTGASASLRGRAGFGQFAASKAGLRSLAQALAREFGPQNIHVAHVIIDGMVDGARLRSALPGLLEQQGEDGTLDPDAIAEAYWHLYGQHRSAWSHELDLRPFRENW